MNPADLAPALEAYQRHTALITRLAELKERFAEDKTDDEPSISVLVTIRNSEVGNHFNLTLNQDQLIGLINDQIRNERSNLISFGVPSYHLNSIGAY